MLHPPIRVNLTPSEGLVLNTSKLQKGGIVLLIDDKQPRRVLLSQSLTLIDPTNSQRYSFLTQSAALSTIKGLHGYTSVNFLGNGTLSWTRELSKSLKDSARHYGKPFEVTTILDQVGLEVSYSPSKVISGQEEVTDWYRSQIFGNQW